MSSKNWDDVWERQRNLPKCILVKGVCEKTQNRIACEEHGYPQSEALYLSWSDFYKDKKSGWTCESCGCQIKPLDDYVARNNKYTCWPCTKINEVDVDEFTFKFLL